MTAKDFLKLGKRDFENGAVRDEIYSTLKEKEFLESVLKNMDIDIRKLYGKAPAYAISKNRN